MPRPKRTSHSLADVMQHLIGAELEGNADVTVSGISLDSRLVQPGDLYAAIPGFRAHGAEFVQQAVERGAVAVLTDPTGLSQSNAFGVPVIVVSDPRRQLGELSAYLYGHAVDRLLSIGITGTNGKTTVAAMIEAGLRAAGRTTGVIGTLGTRIKDEELPSLRTTPEATELHAVFALMEEAGVDSVVMEVSSHALAQGRVDGITFDLAVFTNLSQDHLDFHKDMEEYFSVKATLFTSNRSQSAVVCIDDEWGRRLHDTVTRSRTFSCSGLDADWCGRVLSEGPHGQEIEIRDREGHSDVINIQLTGPFNASNAVAAFAALRELGISATEITRGLSNVRVPGRMQVVDLESDINVVIDYAHSPAAIAEVLTTARSFGQGRIIAVFGAGGDRDRSKRPLMGECAARLADLVILTDDNPRSEPAEEIRAEIAAGIQADTVVLEIPSREEAIHTAIASAAPGDVVVILGKGHERGQEVAGVVHPFSDYDAAHDALTARGAR